MAEIAEMMPCGNEDPEMFFPLGDEKERPSFDQQIAINAAKAVCSSCVVRENCLQTAFERGERHGIWGGMTTAERAKVISKRNRYPSRIAI